MSYGDETIVIVEIDQPLCSRTYGDGAGSPTPASGCRAVLGVDGTRKCYNTRATCQDAANYSPATLTLRFARPQRDLLQYGYVIPSMVSVPATTPAAINLGGMTRSMSQLGQREVVTIGFEDHQHSDLLVDKYRLQRATGAAASGSPPETFDPYERGTFWGKWLARNPYHSGYGLRIREGVLGDTLDHMRVRHYVVDRIDGPVNGLVKLVAKDRFSQIESAPLSRTKKAVAPAASRGELTANMTGSPSTFTVTPAAIVEEDYPLLVGSPSELYVAIGDEIIRCSRSGAVFTVLERGALNTQQENHDDDDLVQYVLVYRAASPHNIAYDLLVNYTALGREGSPSGSDYIDKAAWDTAAASITDLYTAYIAAPTPVNELIAELSEQAGFTLWPDVSTGKINFTALRAAAVSPVVDDDEWILEDSLSTKRQIEKRASQVWVYYGQINPTEALDKKSNFRSRVLILDADAEDDTQYGVPAVREVFSRWIPQFGRSSAQQCGERLRAMFRDPPLEASFAIDASRDGELKLARYFYLQTADVQDESGAQARTPMATVELERGENTIGIKAQQVAFSADVETNAFTIYIENDTGPINLRTIFDSLYSAPQGGSPTTVVAFKVLAGVTVYSTTAATPPITSGSWPAGVALTLENAGSILAAGGVGGAGGSGFGGNGANGQAGGDAISCGANMTVTNSGVIRGGGGGGPGGGGSIGSVGDVEQAGGGGGTGQGYASTVGGSAGTPTRPSSYGQAATGGGTGNQSGPGAAGTGGWYEDNTPGAQSYGRGGNGAIGGAWGAASGTAEAGVAGRPGFQGSAGAVGAAGYAVRKNGFTVTVNNSGTISGATA